jgi:hypothetical protein
MYFACYVLRQMRSRLAFLKASTIGGGGGGGTETPSLDDHTHRLGYMTEFPSRKCC